MRRHFPRRLPENSSWPSLRYRKRTPKAKPKRKPGTRAGLTKSGIAADAAKLIEAVGPGEFSVRKLASATGVGPTSIHAHFKGGTEAVLGAIAAQALAGTTRPFKPTEEAAEYLRELLLKILLVLHARPTVARLVVLRLSFDPILDPLLAERLLLTLTALGVPAEALPKMFQRAMGVILEMILTVSARWTPRSEGPLGASAQGDCGSVCVRVSQSHRIARGPGRRDRRGRSVEAVPEVAALYAGRLIATLSLA